MTARVLKTVVFMGSSKNITPPWGGAPRLGDCVLKHVLATLKARDVVCGEEKVSHEFTVFDPLEVFGEGGALASSGCELKTPHFFFKKGEAPVAMDAMAAIIKAADCILVVTCEYNHGLPPALNSMLNHFGGSNFAMKPSGIVTYSSSPFAGMRVAMAVQPVLHELGCLPVSKLCGFGVVQDIFNEDGSVKDTSNRQLKQLPQLLSQLEWMGIAMANQRAVVPAFHE